MSDPSTSSDLVPIISVATALAAVIISPLVNWIIAKRQIDIAKLQINSSTFLRSGRSGLTNCARTWRRRLH